MSKKIVRAVPVVSLTFRYTAHVEFVCGPPLRLLAFTVKVRARSKSFTNGSAILTELRSSCDVAGAPVSSPLASVCTSTPGNEQAGPPVPGVGVGVGVAVGVGVGVGVGVPLGVMGEATHCGKRKLPIRVRQGAPGSGVGKSLKYSLTYQNVQSSDGSTVSAL